MYPLLSNSETKYEHKGSGMFLDQWQKSIYQKSVQEIPSFLFFQKKFDKNQISFHMFRTSIGFVVHDEVAVISVIPVFNVPTQFRIRIDT